MSRVLASAPGLALLPIIPTLFPARLTALVRLGQSGELGFGKRWKRQGWVGGEWRGSGLGKQSLALVHGLLPGMEALQPPLAQLRDARFGCSGFWQLVPED